MTTISPHRRSHALRTVLLAVFTCGALIAPSASMDAFAETVTVSCSLFAAPSGSDSGSGSFEHPFATVGQLAESLSAGQTGCVRGGVFTEDVKIKHGGSSTAPLTIASYPGERATLVGRLWIAAGSDYVTVANMNLDGKNSSSLPSPTINAVGDRFLGDDVTNEHTEICFLVGSSWGRAKQTVIQGNRIHDCGQIPSRNQDHGIYVDEADNTQILDNVIYKNTDRGIQLYPDAQGTVIERNIIDSNGEGIIFSGEGGTASSNTTVQDNLITNSNIRYDVESWYPSGNPIGQNNTVQTNCVWGGAYGTIQSPQAGFTATNNTTANPEYANPTNGDYRINATSPCATLLATSTIPTQPFTTTSTTTYTAETATTTTTTTETKTTTKKHGRKATAASTRVRHSAKHKHRRRHHKAHGSHRRAHRRHHRHRGGSLSRRG